MASGFGWSILGLLALLFLALPGAFAFALSRRVRALEDTSRAD